MTPPVQEYLPPVQFHEENNHAVQVQQHHTEKGNLRPPFKEYLPPNYYGSGEPHHDIVVPASVTSHHDPHAHYQPPTQEYVVPTHHPQPHHPSPHPSSVVGFAPPSKEYLPPIDYKVKELGPNHPTLVPPSKEYLPPPSTSIEAIGHAIHVKEHHQKHVTVPPTFLPPHEGHQGHHQIVSHHEAGIAPTFLPPHEGHHQIVSHHEAGIAPTFLPPHEKKPHTKGLKDMHITATLNGHEDHHHPGKAHVTSITKDGPYSMNIQINLSGLEDMKKDHHLPPLFRTSKPPIHLKASDHPHHDFHDHEAVRPHMLPDHPSYHNKVMPHMLPHTGHYKEEVKSHHGGHGGLHHGPPPSLPQYVPPPISTHAESYAYKPEHGLPPKEYRPIGHSLHPKQYLPTNPLAYHHPGRNPSYPSYDLKSPDLAAHQEVDPMRTFKPPLTDFRYILSLIHI